MDAITKWMIYLCLSLASVTAFPYTRQQGGETESNAEEYCSSVAVNKLLDSFQLPLGGLVLSHHARVRVKRDNTQGADNVYLRRIMDDALTKLSNTEEALGTFRNRLSFRDSDEKTTQLKRGVAALLNKLSTLQEKCLRNLETGSDVFFTVDDASDFLQPETTPTKGTMVVDATERTQSGFDKTFGKRNNLAFNPSGWRKRRSSIVGDQERMRNFLRNMRQLLDKRQEQRLNFNPTGW